MNCNEIRELISSMLDHELSAEDSAVVTEHLADCPECMRVFEAFHAISVSLEELEDVPEGFTEAVMQKINTPAPVKKRRPGYMRIAGLAACLALVIFTGSQFVTSHLHSDDRNIQDTAQYARVIHQTPKPTPTPTPIATADIAAMSETDLSPVSEETDVTVSNAPVAEANKVADTVPTPDAVSPAPEAEATPRPTATPMPTPVAAPAALSTLNDLLYAVEAADFNLHSEQPAYKLMIQDESGNTIQLLIWLEGERIYCKDPVEGSAWYAVGTADTLEVLVNGIAPVTTPTVS